MNRSDLIDLVHARFPSLTHDDASTAVSVVLEAITETLASGDRVEVRGFGTFTLNYRPARTGRNPRTGEKVAVPEKHIPHFKAGKGLRDGVDTQNVALAKRDLILESAKRERQAMDHMAVRIGARSAQSMHLINREVAKSLKVQFADVDFD